MSSTKDAVATMGAILPADAGGRDAVHVAVVAVTAYARLEPGQRVGLMPNLAAENGEHFASGGPALTRIGIVDPFIEGVVKKGDRFWLYLYPRTITALSHRWSHPSFPDASPAGVYVPPSSKLASEQWLKDFSERSDCPGYHSLIALAEQYIRDGDTEDYLLVRGSDAHGDIPAEFWTHIENVTGLKAPAEPPAYFSCSC